jgi:hypothetical protein
MAFTMASPNFKKGVKMAFGPLGVKSYKIFKFSAHLRACCQPLAKPEDNYLGEL